MRKVLLLLTCIFAVATTITAQNVGIGTNTPNAAAILDVNSSDKGLLPPRLSTIERNAMPAKTAGLIIFNTNSGCLELFNGVNWINLCSSLPSTVLPKTLLGGNQSDKAYSIRQTADSGYIIGGSTESSEDGDVTGINKGGLDCWVVKLSKTGIKEWDKVFGGTGYDELVEIKQTADGGYVFAALCGSSANGDISGTNHGQYDYWIVKLDADGNKAWDVLLGGNQYDYVSAVSQTADGGYIVGGYSTSSANGDVTPTSHGNSDYWIVKLNSTGAITWNVLLGGNGEEVLNTIAQTTDGGYIATGNTSFGVSGNVTGPVNGGFDFWVVKINSTGAITWNRTIGGAGEEFSYSVQQTADGGYIVAGNSNSAASGNITSSTHGDLDMLIVKLDASGNTTWNNMFGGSAEERVNEIMQTADGGYIMAGLSWSSTSGNITQNNSGIEDAWIVKIDNAGNHVWNKLYGGNNSDIATSIRQTFDGGYIFGGYTRSSANGTVIGTNHDPSGDSDDFWVVKLDANGNIE